MLVRIAVGPGKTGKEMGIHLGWDVNPLDTFALNKMILLKSDERKQICFTRHAGGEGEKKVLVTFYSFP